VRQVQNFNVNKNAAYPKAFKELKEEEVIPDNGELRQVKYLPVSFCHTAGERGRKSRGQNSRFSSIEAVK
jgi:hypothetical protein